MSREIEERPMGYPGLMVSGPARLSPTPATLKRVALAKLADVRFFSATFDGEGLLFEPWLTTLIDYGTSTCFLGVYRTEEALEEPDGADAPTLCLRRSEWVRETDLAQAGEAEDLREYLRTGPQVDNSFVFGTAATHPELSEETDRLVSTLAGGLTITAPEPRGTDWHEVTVEVADDRVTATFDYAPLLAQCTVLETHLPLWLDCAEALGRHAGMCPDGAVTLSLRRSVPEMLEAPWRPVSG